MYSTKEYHCINLVLHKLININSCETSFSPSLKSGSPSQSLKGGAPHETLSQTPSGAGDKDDKRDEAGTPTSLGPDGRRGLPRPR